MTVPHEPLVTKQLKVKLDALVHILSTVSFTQCLVFSNHQTRWVTVGRVGDRDAEPPEPAYFARSRSRSRSRWNSLLGAGVGAV